jgi:hypothetical protein
MNITKKQANSIKKEVLDFINKNNAGSSKKSGK